MKYVVVLLFFSLPALGLSQCNFFDSFSESEDFQGCGVEVGVWTFIVFAQNPLQPYVVQTFVDGVEVVEPEFFVGSHAVELSMIPPGGQSFTIEYLVHYGADIASATCTASHVRSVIVESALVVEEVVQLSVDQGVWCSESDAGQVTLVFPTPELDFWNVFPTIVADNGDNGWPVEMNADNSVVTVLNLNPGNYNLVFSSSTYMCYAAGSIPFSISEVYQPTYVTEIIAPFVANTGVLQVNFNTQLGVNVVSLSEGIASGNNPITIENLSGEPFEMVIALEGGGCEWTYMFDPEMSGCTDVSACNYNALALVDDGSCMGLMGCMNENAVNYDPNATCSGFCSFIADFNGDGSVNVADLLEFTSYWACEGNNCLGDFDGDSFVGSADLLLFLSLFGES
ncbi:MAG: hypothetical protein GC193_07270 [Cryomorphaceae bacterium]|nr:hypothetical protein [Cryomorphaceae bacterium]